MRKPPHEPSPARFRYSTLLREIDSMQAADGVSTVALMLIQLSGLDEINSRFGYLGGDRVLEEFASRLAAVARDQDRAFEIDGRTFAILIRNPLHEGHAVLAADKVARAAADPVTIGIARVAVKARIGISLMPRPANCGEDLLRQCELGLHAARARDESHVIFTPDLGNVTTLASHSWFDVEEALRQGEFELFYQPKLDLRSLRLVGAEALVRWHKPGTGYIPPGSFLPAIEHSQGMRPLLSVLLNSGLRQAASWSRRHAEFSIALNLATANLEDPDLAELIEDALSVWSLAPSQLTLELTESSLMQSPAASMRMMARLRDIGLRTSIDDFGTGYSSLAYLRDLPADELKIDRSFIGAISRGGRDSDIVASIVQLAHAVELQVVAEGIEQAAMVPALVSMGCDVGQGYHFGAPVSAREFEDTWFRSDGVEAIA